jgi:hypothetical protein
LKQGKGKKKRKTGRTNDKEGTQKLNGKGLSAKTGVKANVSKTGAWKAHKAGVSFFSPHRALVRLGLGPELRSRKLPPHDGGDAEDHDLANAYHAAGGVVQGQRVVYDVVRVEASQVVHGGRQVNEPFVSKSGGNTKKAVG